MRLAIVVLSGPICSGKTTLARLLAERRQALHVKTQELIYELRPATQRHRKSLQKVGDQLDRDTEGRWVSDGLLKQLARFGSEQPALVVVDSVRIESQVEALRRAFGGAVVHVHLEASDAVLAGRYAKRSPSISELPDYKAVRSNKTERLVPRLANLADVVIETGRCTPSDIYVRVAARLGFRFPREAALVDVIVGGQYGSEGKGNIVHYLAPEYDVLLRVGGPNAGHKVYRPDEEPYVFHQLPSGALANGNALLVLGAGTVISLDRVLKEIAELSVSVTRLVIDPQAMIIDTDDIKWESEQLRDTIASTAQGVGRATARKILGRFPGSDVRLAKDVPALKHYVSDSLDAIGDAMASGKRIMLEGTQGTSLSLHHGHYPHVTSRVTTATGCLAEAGIAPHHVRRVVMVCRTYPIRVGNTDTGATSGFMRQEITLSDIAGRSGIPLEELERVERTSTTNRDRRIAEFDWEQFRRALILNGATDIALTFVDYLNVGNREAYRYEQLTSETLRFIEELEKVGGVPVSLMSTRFDLRNIIDRRAW